MQLQSIGKSNKLNHDEYNIFQGQVLSCNSFAFYGVYYCIESQSWSYYECETCMFYKGRQRQDDTAFGGTAKVNGAESGWAWNASWWGIYSIILATAP